MVKQWLARLRNRPIQIYVVVVSLYTLIQLLIQGPNIPNIGKVCPVYYILAFPYSSSVSVQLGLLKCELYYFPVLCADVLLLLCVINEGV